MLRVTSTDGPDNILTHFTLHLGPLAAGRKQKMRTHGKKHVPQDLLLQRHRKHLPNPLNRKGGRTEEEELFTMYGNHSSNSKHGDDNDDEETAACFAFCNKFVVFLAIHKMPNTLVQKAMFV